MKTHVLELKVHNTRREQHFIHEQVLAFQRLRSKLIHQQLEFTAHDSYAPKSAEHFILILFMLPSHKVQKPPTSVIKLQMDFTFRNKVGRSP